MGDVIRAGGAIIWEDTREDGAGAVVDFKNDVMHLSAVVEAAAGRIEDRPRTEWPLVTLEEIRMAGRDCRASLLRW